MKFLHITIIEIGLEVYLVLQVSRLNYSKPIIINYYTGCQHYRMMYYYTVLYRKISQQFNKIYIKGGVTKKLIGKSGMYDNSTYYELHC